MPMASVAPDAAAAIAISVIVPVYNEELNVDELHDRIAAVLTADDVEFLFIDDGSSDSTFDRLSALAARDPRIRLIRFRRNYGQTAALSAGIDHARGDIIVPMDGDLQNDPRIFPGCSPGSTKDTTWSAAGESTVRTHCGSGSRPCSPIV